VTETTTTQESTPPADVASQKPTPEREEASHLEEAKKRITLLESQLQEKDNKYKYLVADLENLKKRTLKERGDLLKFGWETLAKELLQVIDSMERALQHASPQTDQSLLDGLHMTLKQLKASLEKQGVQHIDTKKKSFDPHIHEAVGQVPSENHPAGTIIEEHMTGYMLHGRLLRPAKVIISGGQQSTEQKPKVD